MKKTTDGLFSALWAVADNNSTKLDKEEEEDDEEDNSMFNNNDNMGDQDMPTDDDNFDIPKAPSSGKKIIKQRHITMIPPMYQIV